MSDVLGVGSIVGAIAGLIQNERSIDAASNLASENREFQWQTLAASQAWQERMRATAYQATMQDMRAAGLNPMLAMHRGASPIGSASAAPGSTVTPSQTSIAESAAAGARIAQSAIMIRDQLENIQSQTAFNRANATKAEAEAASALAQARWLANREVSEAGVPAVQAGQIGLMGAQARAAIEAAGHSAAEAERSRQQVRVIEGHGVPGGFTHPQAFSAAIEALLNRIRAATGQSGRQTPSAGDFGGSMPEIIQGRRGRREERR